MHARNKTIGTGLKKKEGDRAISLRNNWKSFNNELVERRCLTINVSMGKSSMLMCLNQSTEGRVQPSHQRNAVLRRKFKFKLRFPRKRSRRIWVLWHIMYEYDINVDVTSSIAVSKIENYQRNFRFYRRILYGQSKFPKNERGSGGQVGSSGSCGIHLN